MFIKSVSGHPSRDFTSNTIPEIKHLGCRVVMSKPIPKMPFQRVIVKEIISEEQPSELPHLENKRSSVTVYNMEIAKRMKLRPDLRNPASGDFVTYTSGACFAESNHCLQPVNAEETGTGRTC